VAVVPPASAGWSTVFSDDFSGIAGSPVSSGWQYDLGTQYPGGAPHWGTGEVETATNSTSNVYQDGGGHLVIKPLRDASGHWTSGRIETRRTDFAAPVGGQMEMIASIQQPNPSSALGYWPAFWALGAAARPVGATNWPSIGELDTMEDVNGRSQVSHTFHCGVWAQPPCNEPTGTGSGLLACDGCQVRYHTYSVTVDRRNPAAEQLRFATDGVARFVVNESQIGAAAWATAVDHGFFMILNVAIAGSYPDIICGCNSSAASPTSGAGMSVDYVAVYQTPAAKPGGGAPTNSTRPTRSSTAANSGNRTTSAAAIIQAENASARSAGAQITPVVDAGSGRAVTASRNGSWLRYDRINFGASAPRQFLARMTSRATRRSAGRFEVHLDSLATPAVASIPVTSGGVHGAWMTPRTKIRPARGVHTVYLKFVSKLPGSSASINWFRFV
jgi:hypothetical protein